MLRDTTPTRIPEYDDQDESGRKLALIYQCQEKWETLQATDNARVRYCGTCSQPVFYVSDANGVHRAAAAGRCVMVKREADAMCVGKVATQYSVNGSNPPDS